MKKLVGVLATIITVIVTIAYDIRCEYNPATASHYWNKRLGIFSITGELYPEMDMLTIVEVSAVVNDTIIRRSGRMKRNALYHELFK